MCKVNKEAPCLGLRIAVEALREYLKCRLIYICGMGERDLNLHTNLSGALSDNPYCVTRLPTISVPSSGRFYDSKTKWNYSFL